MLVVCLSDTTKLSHPNWPFLLPITLKTVSKAVSIDCRVKRKTVTSKIMSMVVVQKLKKRPFSFPLLHIRHSTFSERLKKELSTVISRQTMLIVTHFDN